MFFSSSYLLAAIALVSSVSATPSARSSGSGTAYFITNDPSGNKILSLDIASNGKIGSVSAVSAGGRGAQGIRTPSAQPDGLFSQGAIKLNAAAKILVTVNPGSNTVSMFNINPENPSKLTMVGDPVSSEGEFPVSVAINAKATMVCVLNGGAVNGVNCYTPDPKLGLIAKPNTLRSLGLNETTPATGPAGTASHIVFSEDGTKLIAAVKGVPPTPGFLAAWSIAADGSLSAEPVKSSPSSGGVLFSLTAVKGTNAFVVTDAATGFEVFDFGSQSSLSATSSVVPIKGQITTCWSTFSPKSGNYYLTDLGASTISEIHVDKNLNGTLVKQYPQAKGSGTIDDEVATIGGNDYLYVLAPGATTVFVFNVNKPGQATPVQNFNFAAPAKAAGVTINPDFPQGMAVFVRN